MPIKGNNDDSPMDLWDFSKIVGAPFNWEPLPHINLIIELLHYALAGQIENLAVALSPRLGKSVQISEIFPAYYLGYRPYGKVILVSYGEDLVLDFGEFVRDTFKEYGYLFPTNPQLKQDSKSKSRFKIKDDVGGFYGSTLSGGVLGYGGTLIITDDPLKNMEQAESEVYQDKIQKLFDTTITTRKEKDPYTGQPAINIVAHQRLGEKDLIGIILEKEPWISAEEALPLLRQGKKMGHKWVYLRLPELAEENDILGRAVGEPIWPTKRNKEELTHIESAMGERYFNTIHQQDPQPKPNQYFQPDYFEIIHARPQNIVSEIEWVDLADTAYPEDMALSKRGAATAGIQLALTADSKLIITNIFEFWKEDDERDKSIIQNAKLQSKKVKHIIPQDPGQAGKSQIHIFSIKLPGYNFDGVIERGSKEDRAEPVGNWAKINKIYILDDGRDLLFPNKYITTYSEQIQRFITQCCNFPRTKQKDLVDAFSGAYSELDIPEVQDKAPIIGSLDLW
jgi:phage terminase large subunit-like protein